MYRLRLPGKPYSKDQAVVYMVVINPDGRLKYVEYSPSTNQRNIYLP